MFLQTAVESDEDLGKHLIVDEYSVEFLVFLGNEFNETKEILAILRLIQLVSLYIRQSNITSHLDKLRESLPEW